MLQTHPVDSIKIKKLTVRDLDKIKDMILKHKNAFSKSNIFDLISSSFTEADKKEADKKDDSTGYVATVVSIGVEVLMKLSVVSYDEFSLLASELIEGCNSIEDYKNLPISAPAEVIIQIAEAPEVEAFFTLSSRLSKMTGVLEKPMNAIKRMFDSSSEDEEKKS